MSDKVIQVVDTELTVANMIKDGRLKEGEHYLKDGKSISFVPDEIIRYKMNPPSRMGLSRFCMG